MVDYQTVGAVEMDLQEQIDEHVADLVALAQAGDVMAIKSLGVICVFAVGYIGGPDGDGEPVIDLEDYRTKLAA